MTIEKRVLWLLVLFLAISLMACGKEKSSPEREEGNNLLMEGISVLGVKKQDAATAFGKTESDLEEMEQLFHYHLKETIAFEGHEWDVILNEDQTQETICGCDFLTSFQNKEEALNAFSSLIQVIKDEYGEPSTSKDFPTTEEMRTDPEGFLEEKGSIYEAWNLGQGKVQGELKQPIEATRQTIEKYDDLYLGIVLTVEKQVTTGDYLVRIRVNLNINPAM